MSDSRRDFLKKSALLSLSGLAGSLIGREQLEAVEQISGSLSGAAFTLPKLPYAYGALEPFIDKQTMEIHHTKHHQAYIDKLNSAPSMGNIDMKADDAGKCRSVDQATPALIRDNLGGYYNHALFWTLLRPNPEGKANTPAGELSSAIQKQFGSFEAFKKAFSDKATGIFGSGWCWLILDEKKQLKITNTPNQDNPLMKVAAEQGTPVLALDVWEHAYYLKYQNKRADYITNWWQVVNWEQAGQLFAKK